MESERHHSVRISVMPLFANVRLLLGILEGLPEESLNQMDSIIRNYGKTKDSDEARKSQGSWIDDLPDGVGKNLAKRIIEESDGKINPRYLQAERALMKQYDLMTVDGTGINALTGNGKKFQSNREKSVEIEIDKLEGTIAILSSLIRYGICKSSDIAEDFDDFLKEHTADFPKYTYPYLNSRLNNLVDRELVNRNGNFYEITTDGRKYLEKIDPENQTTRITADAEANQAKVRSQLRDHLVKMDAIPFEGVVARLFEALQYEDVEDRQASHDGGVDVIATKDFGFGPEKVAIQVKRYATTKIKRDVIALLRADMRKFPQVTRGIVVTTSTFSQDAKDEAKVPGEIPIYLIDGEALINLFIDVQLGIKQVTVTYYDFQPGDLIVEESKPANE